MKILVSGLLGYMGNEVAKLAEQGCRGAELIAGVDPCAAKTVMNSHTDIPCYVSFDQVKETPDCIVDFSHHAGTEALLEYAVRTKTPVVIATTGQTEEEKQMIEDAAQKTAVFFAANMSFGIALLIELAKKTAAAMPEAEIEIVETHHDRKIDAPSGTALAIAEAIRSVRPDAQLHPGRSGQGRRTRTEIGIHSIRMGNVVGEHEVIIGTQNQTIILKHQAHSRALFAEGALAAAEFLTGKPAGRYSMDDLI